MPDAGTYLNRLQAKSGSALLLDCSAVEIVEPLKVVSKGKDWMQAWDQIWKW